MLNFRSALTLSSWPMIVFFTVALIPFSIKLGDQGISANYLFFLFPILVLLSGKSLILPQRLYLEFIAIYIAILCLATAYQYTLLGEFDRRLVSFTIFMGMFVFMFVKITPKMVVGFKISVILISLYFSIYSIYGYILEGAEVLGFSAKDVVGTQRIGFVYIVAFWILLLFRTQSIMMRALKISAISCIFFGLLLTFSRASIVALVGSLIVYNVMHSYESRAGARQGVPPPPTAGSESGCCRRPSARCFAARPSSSPGTDPAAPGVVAPSSTQSTPTAASRRTPGTSGAPRPAACSRGSGRRSIRLSNRLSSALRRTCRNSRAPSSQRRPRTDVGGENRHARRRVSLSICSHSKIAIEMTSSPVAQPGNPSRTQSDAPFPSNRRGMTVSCNASKARGSRKKLETLIRRWRNRNVTSPVSWRRRST